MCLCERKYKNSALDFIYDLRFVDIKEKDKI